MGTKRIVTYKCMYCNKRFDRHKLVYHVQNKHEDLIPEGFTALRLVFNYVNKKPMDYHGKCTECGKSTPWDENKGRYDRQCGSKACHDSFVRKFEENMMKTRGTTRISATAEGQKKMLANRKISGTYTMQDGSKKTYTGSYELKALEFMDKVLHIKGDDILCPGPILEYSFEGKTHIYITDFYYQPYNLVIEVKDGGDNPNKRNMPEYRAKQIAKEMFIIKHTNYNYLRLTNNNLEQLMIAFADLKYQLVENTGDRVIHVNEHKDNPISEYMNALTSGKVAGLEDSDCIMINFPQNNVFSKGISNPSFDKVITRNNKTGKLVVIKPKDEGLEIDDKMYKTHITIDEAVKRVSSMIDKEVDEDYLHKTILEVDECYTEDEIKFLAKEFSLKECKGIPVETLHEFMDFLGNKNELDFIQESVERIKNG